MRPALLLLPLLLLASPVLAKKNNDELTIDNSKVVGITRMLEEQPLDESAPLLRALMMEWEDKSKDVVDIVCADVLAPVLEDDVKYGPELLGQFIFGSAAYQIENPSEKGKLVPAQIAGMRSLLKAYANFLKAEPDTHVAYLDDLAKKEAEGTLAAHMEAVVIEKCSPDTADE